MRRAERDGRAEHRQRSRRMDQRALLVAHEEIDGAFLRAAGNKRGLGVGGHGLQPGIHRHQPWRVGADDARVDQQRGLEEGVALRRQRADAILVVHEDV